MNEIQGFFTSLLSCKYSRSPFSQTFQNVYTQFHRIVKALLFKKKINCIIIKYVVLYGCSVQKIKKCLKAILYRILLWQMNITLFFLTFTFPQVCTLYFSSVFKLHICHPSYSCSRTLRYYKRTLFLLWAVWRIKAVSSRVPLSATSPHPLGSRISQGSLNRLQMLAPGEKKSTSNR